jgi:hypothetical protein
VALNNPLYRWMLLRQAQQPGVLNGLSSAVANNPLARAVSPYAVPAGVLGGNRLFQPEPQPAQ